MKTHSPDKKKGPGLWQNFYRHRLQRLLSSDKDIDHDLALDLIRTRQEPADLDLLVEYLKKQPKHCRLTTLIIRCLGDIKYGPAEEPLRQALQSHPDDRVRSLAGEALIATDVPFVSQDLIAMYPAAGYSLCPTLVQMLGRTRSRDAAVFLTGLLKSAGTRHTLTVKIIAALRDIADPVCVPLLLDWIGQNSQYAHDCAECLLRVEDPAIAPALMDLFRAGERPYLAPYIGRLKVPQAGEMLVQAHCDLYAGGGIPDPQVSARLMEGFKNLADPRTLPYVHEGLRVHWDKYYDSAACDFNTAIYILRPALEVLRAIGDRSSLDLLLSLSTRDYAGGLVDTVTALVTKFRTELEPAVWMRLRHWRVTQVISEDGWRWERKVDTTELQMLVRDHIHAA